MDRKKIIKIDRYFVDVDQKTHTVKYYAVKGKEKYEMPDCYKSMYDDKHLAIIERTMNDPELYNTTAIHYVPLRTVR